MWFSINEEILRKRRKKKYTYGTETESRDKAFVEKPIGEEEYGWNSIGYGKYVIQFKGAFSGSVVWLQSEIRNYNWIRINKTWITVVFQQFKVVGISELMEDLVGKGKGKGIYIKVQ